MQELINSIMLLAYNIILLALCVIMIIITLSIKHRVNILRNIVREIKKILENKEDK